MPLEPEVLYRQLGQLIAEMPDDLAGPGPISAATQRWLGRAAILVDDGHARLNLDLVNFTTACDSLSGAWRERNAHQIQAILYRTLARAELNAPAGAQGAFIAAGNAFEVLQAMAKVLLEAGNRILIVDPYMDATVLTHFAQLANEGVTIKLLTDSASTSPAAMQPAVERWIAQYAALRPIEMRFTRPRLLHDRFIIVDSIKVWEPTQSLKDFARRSYGSINRIDGDLAPLKVAAYELHWAEAIPL